MPELTDLLSRLTDDQPPVGITRESAIAAGRRARNRRRGLFGAAACALTVAVAAAVTMSPVARQDRTGTAPAPAPARLNPVSRLPPADAPGAAERPDLVGTDRRVFHFALEGVTTQDGVTYVSGDGLEMAVAGWSSVVLTRDRAAAERVADSLDAGRSLDRRAVTVGGRPGTLMRWTGSSGAPEFLNLVWDPIDGLSVGVGVLYPATEGTIWALVGALRLDMAQRCVTPFSLTDVPSGLRLVNCASGVPVAGGPYWVSRVELGDAAGNAITVSVGQGDEPGLAPGPGASRTVAGHPVEWFDGPTRALRSKDFDGVPVTVGVKGSFGETEATRVLAGLRLADDRAGPFGWPADPVPGIP